MFVERLLNLSLLISQQNQVLMQIVQPADVEVQLRLRLRPQLRDVILTGCLEPCGGQCDYMLFLRIDGRFQRRYLLRNRQRFALERRSVGLCLAKRYFKSLVDGVVGNLDRLYGLLLLIRAVCLGGKVARRGQRRLVYDPCGA